MAALFAGSALAACEEEHVHVMTYISATEATCTQEGVVEHWNCTECGKNYSDEEGTEELSFITIAALGHDFGPYEVETAPTCTEEGVEASVCSRCSEKQTRTVAALGHEWGEGVVTTEPTCSREGVRTYSCSRCEEEKTEAISALAHTPGEAVRENEVAATCTSDGSVDIVVSCTVCGEEISRETETIKALGHSWNSGIVTSYPNCTQAGQRKYTCTRCGDTKTETIGALGHSWNSGVVTEEPTCTEDGLRTYTCTRCSDTKTETIGALGHEEGEAVRENEVAATCEKEGSYDLVVYCTRCGEEISRTRQTIAALGHSWNSGVVTEEPTCTEDGLRTYTCTRCSDTKTETIGALGHEEGEAVRENEVAATCEKEGSYDLVVYCTRCGEEISRTGQTIAALGHKPSATWESDENGHYKTCANDPTERLESSAHTYEWVTDRDPTCTAEGSRHRECSICSYIEAGSEESIAMIAHDYKLDEYETDYSVCEGGTQVYRCTLCMTATREEDFKGKGHNYEGGRCTVCGDPEPTNIFTVSSVSGSARDTVTVTITLGGVVKNVGFIAEFSYDSSRLLYRGYTAGGYTLTVNPDYSEDTIRFVCDNYINYTSGGTVVTFTFQVLPSAETGTSALDLEIVEIKETWKDLSIHVTPSRVNDGTLTID